ncbi:serine hydrolase domain-containing protein [Nocardia huaxiensis]|uniref:Beta-lactamase family protein n=1 Tax=Nocardia huaxiensis TaxID=2755382 RepID=A0A7D6ZGV3_9NOCA|nr:serine hydrolase domain-containing protein [Nocardia huaxiensis]QLY27703.1 beta-lactamase family protein [Nocardia huaxiensis]UFS98908.1 beta-lactamase family protein [Nocardia huaxiensis]
MAAKTFGIMLVAATAAFATAGTPAADADELTGLLQADLDAIVTGMDVPGAQLVLRDGERNRLVASGVGDIATGAGFPDNAQFRIASNTKTFVAVVVLQLVGEGRVELDAPIERYLPGVVRGPGGDGNAITVRQLLQHTSGIPDYLPMLELESVAALRQWKTADDLIALGLGEQAQYRPGERAVYSNTNYLLAGKLVEQVTGAPVGVEVTRRILMPLQLVDTYWPVFPAENTIRGPHAQAYHEFGGNRVDVTDIDPGWGLSDGAMVSTSADLSRFYAALVSGAVLGPDQLAEMRKTVPSGDFRRSEEFGLGLFHWVTSCGADAWGHGGTMHGSFVYGGATTGRSVTVSMNQIPDIFGGTQQRVDMHQVVDDALCANG